MKEFPAFHTSRKRGKHTKDENEDNRNLTPQK